MKSDHRRKWTCILREAQRTRRRPTLGVVAPSRTTHALAPACQRQRSVAGSTSSGGMHQSLRGPLTLLGLPSISRSQKFRPPVVLAWERSHQGLRAPQTRKARRESPGDSRQRQIPPASSTAPIDSLVRHNSTRVSKHAHKFREVVSGAQRRHAPPPEAVDAGQLRAPGPGRHLPEQIQAEMAVQSARKRSRGGRFAATRRAAADVGSCIARDGYTDGPNLGESRRRSAVAVGEQLALISQNGVWFDCVVSNGLAEATLF